MMGGNGLSSGGFGGGMGTPGGLQLSALRNSFAGMMGGLPGAGQTGINRSLSAGINYSNEWTTKLKGTGSYFYSDSDIDQEQTMFQRNTFPNDSVSSLSRDYLSTNRNQNHRINIRLEARLDSMSSILFRPGLRNLFLYSRLLFQLSPSLALVVARLPDCTR